MNWGPRRNKVTECTCQVLWDGIIEILDTRTPSGLLVREAAREIDAFYEAVVSCDIAIEIRDLLVEHLEEFSQCPCQTAKHIRMIWILPAIQDINYSHRVPVSLEAAQLWNEKFQRLQKIIKKGGEIMVEPEKTAVQCPECDCPMEIKEGEEVVCHCKEGCDCDGGRECCHPEPDPSS